MSSEQKKHFLEVSVCVMVLEKQNADDYHGRLIDGHKTSGWILCEKRLPTQANGRAGCVFHAGCGFRAGFLGKSTRGG